MPSSSEREPTRALSRGIASRRRREAPDCGHARRCCSGSGWCCPDEESPSSEGVWENVERPFRRQRRLSSRRVLLRRQDMPFLRGIARGIFKTHAFQFANQGFTPRDFNLLRLHWRGNRSLSLLRHHQLVGIADVVFQLIESGSLTEHARNLRQSADKPVSILPNTPAGAEENGPSDPP